MGPDIGMLLRGPRDDSSFEGKFICSATRGDVDPQGRETFLKNRVSSQTLVWQWVAPLSSCCFTQNARDLPAKWGA